MHMQETGPFDSFVSEFLEGVAAALPTGHAERLRQDIRAARVTRNGDFLDVDLPHYQRPEYRGHRNLPFEGKMSDAEGGAMSVLVNMDENDRLLAVEFIWWENSIAVAPDWSTLKIIPEAPVTISDKS